MALRNINIDDRSYEQFLTVMRQHLQTTELRDHNPSDPSSVILELLCWAAEMSLYRMNRIPQTHHEKFLDLLIDPPEAVTTEITLRRENSKDHELIIQPGHRFATDYKDGKRFVFETLKPVVFPKPKNVGDAQTRSAIAREKLVIVDEILGVSNGEPNQVFKLTPSRKQLGLNDIHPVPVLLDFVYGDPESSIYNPNPTIKVGNVNWELKQFLLTADSKFDSKHYMVDPQNNLIHFGDGKFGSIPPDGEQIVCTQYQLLQGPPALIKQDEITRILDPIPDLLGSEQVVLGDTSDPNNIKPSNTDAIGGLNYVSKDKRESEGLKKYRQHYRLVTSDDFELALLRDFNEFFELAKQRNIYEVLNNENKSERIIAAIALMNKRPSIEGIKTTVGHVTVMIIESKEINELSLSLRQKLIDETSEKNPIINEEGIVNIDLALDCDINLNQKQELLDIEERTKDWIKRFLDERRLITTRLHIISPKVKNINRLVLHVAIHKDKNEDEVKNNISNEVLKYLSLIHGGDVSKGWKPGENVYRSKLYRVIEDMDDVDHVNTLFFEPSGMDGGVIELKDIEIPSLSRKDILIYPERT